MTAALDRVFVTEFALSASYCPGPTVLSTFVVLFWPIVKVFELEFHLTPSSYCPGATSMSPLFATGLDGDLPRSMLTTLVLVRVSALSGEYAPGPRVFSTFFERFSPILKDFTLEFHRTPSSYYPGPTCSAFYVAKVSGLAFSLFMIAAFERVFVTEFARSASYWPGPAVISIFCDLFSPILNDLTF